MANDWHNYKYDKFEKYESKTLMTVHETEQLLNNSMEKKTCFSSATAIGTISREIFTVCTVYSDAILQEGTAVNLQVKVCFTFS